ncbi:MAG: hypothetical protein K0R41_299 [Geminicoccaceae bacterium]|jgi:hypothetical protein|nr:hypothetical protein [Geminicoccaceae bacterium]
MRETADRPGLNTSKGTVDVPVVDGVIELRGESGGPEDKEELEAQARAVPEVGGVKSMLHLPKVPGPVAPAAPVAKTWITPTES